MKAFINDVDYKIIPEHYEEVFNVKLLENPKRKRLTEKERLAFEVNYVKSILNQAQREAVARSAPLHVNRITTRDGGYYTAELDNGHEIRICEYDWTVNKYISRNY